MIPTRLLIASGPFPGRIGAERALAALARGVRSAGAPDPDVVALPGAGSGGELRALLERARFDERLRAARALVIGCARLDERTLLGSAAFELATRARQGGIPAYAVAAESALDAFDARVLDLQLILRARGERGLAAAGRTLAQLS